jgi:DNA-binding GntR family transcriptional regulator
MKDRVYETLRTLILHGKLLPGQPLVEAQLAPQLGTSKTPLREAFLRLEGDGLVTLSPHRGASVQRLALNELRDCQFVRLELEVAAFKLGAERITPAQLEEARQLLSRMREEAQKADWDTYRQCHRRFHATLYRATDNQVLAKTLLDLFDRMQRYSQLCLERNHEYWRRDEEDHHAAFAAFERRDVDAFRAIFDRMNANFLAYVEDAVRRRDSGLFRYFADGLSKDEEGGYGRSHALPAGQPSAGRPGSAARADGPGRPPVLRRHLRPRRAGRRPGNRARLGR